MTQLVLAHQDADVRWLRLNRPERRNALNPALVTALRSAVREAVADADTRIVVIAGAGRSFCAGADLGHLRVLAEQEHDPLPFLASISECFTEIEQAPKPVVAAVHGHVVAGGLELALVCDLVVAQRGTLIGDGHLRSGLLPAAGSSVRLPRKVGEPLARWLILSGRLLPAEAFVASGFVHAVAAPDDVDSVLADILEGLRSSAATAQRHGKRLLNEQARLIHETGLAREQRAFVQNWHDSNVAMALTRFAERSA